MYANLFDGILIHYSEIALKGDNRAFFENALLESIKKHLSGLPDKKIKKLYGRIFIEAEITASNKPDYEQALLHVFGIANFSFAKKVKSLRFHSTNHETTRFHGPNHGTVQSHGTDHGTMEKIKSVVIESLKAKKPKTFKIETMRSDKRFFLTSLEVSRTLGATVVRELNLPVNVKNPEITCFIEITTQGIFIYLDKIQGLGGLPAGVSGTMLGFLSGGIDSPVACFRMMNRGTQVIFVHFHSYPQTSRASIDKVKELAEILNKYQPDSKLYLVSFLDIQKQIMINCQADLRVILYRRMMMRIGNEIARSTRAQAIITGESLGQVASQTIENLAVIEKVSETPVLRPLVGSDKNEIIELARRIGTYDISIRPHDDCCQVFLPKHPATKARLENMEKEESRLEIDRLVKEAVNKTSLLIY